VWSKYKKNILNIFKVPINESVDRKDDLIDKISDYMVDDTEYELSISQYNVDSTEIFVYIRYPYSAQDSGFPYTIYEVSTIKESSEYILNRVEIEYMWDVYNIRSVKTIEDIFKKYTEKLFTKIYDDMLRVKGNNINESVDRKSDYLDKIVDFMIDDTEYNIYINRFSDHSETKVEIWYPFTNPDEDVDAYDYSIYDIYDWSNGSGFNLDEGEDIDYICNTYSICDIDTVQELYDRYIQKLSTIIYEEMLLKKNGDRLNESVNRKDEYLDKIVEFLVTDTKVLVNDDVFFAPFYRLSSLSFNLLFYKGDYPASFHRYCRDVYGINSDDIKYVWDTYKNIIKDKFNNSGNINESVDRKDEYLDKIVGFIVDDTEITIEKNDKSFKPPFTSVWFSPLYLKLMSDSQLEINFLTYCKDTYGLTNSEIKVVISKYRKTILNKFKGS
jgi:flavin-binding protein dodecin